MCRNCYQNWYWKNNPEQYQFQRTRMREYRENNLEKFREYYKKRRDYFLEKSRQFRKDHPDYDSQRERVRRKTLKEVSPVVPTMKRCTCGHGKEHHDCGFCDYALSLEDPKSEDLCKCNEYTEAP